MKYKFQPVSLSWQYNSEKDDANFTGVATLRVGDIDYQFELQNNGPVRRLRAAFEQCWLNGAYMTSKRITEALEKVTEEFKP